jgi:hypothetical protein
LSRQGLVLLPELVTWHFDVVLLHDSCSFEVCWGGCGQQRWMLFAYNGCVVQLDEHSHILMSSIVRFGVQPLMFVLFLTIMFPWNSSGISMEFAFIPWNQEWIAPIPHGMQWNPYGINHCMTIP